MENRKKPSSKVGFGLLYRKFKATVILHFFLTIAVVVFSNYLSLTNNEIFSEGGTVHVVDHNCNSGHCRSETQPSISLKNSVDNKNLDNNSSVMKNDKDYGKYLPFLNY